MRTRVLAPLALVPVVGLWIEVCEAQPPSQTWRSGTKSLDSSTTNSDAEP
jgi:hypothetical protein